MDDLGKKTRILEEEVASLSVEMRNCELKKQILTEERAKARAEANDSDIRQDNKVAVLLLNQ